MHDQWTLHLLPFSQHAIPNLTWNSFLFFTMVTKRVLRTIPLRSVARDWKLAPNHGENNQRARMLTPVCVIVSFRRETCAYWPVFNCRPITARISSPIYLELLRYSRCMFWCIQAVRVLRSKFNRQLFKFCIFLFITPTPKCPV